MPDFRLSLPLATLALFSVPLLNGFPLLYHDTAYYLHYALATEIDPGWRTILFRPLTYSLFLRAADSVFLAVFAQGLWLASLIFETGVTLGLRRSCYLPAMAFGVLFTPMAIYSGFVLPDVFFAIQVLSFFLALHSRERPAARAGFVASFVIASMMHYSNLILCGAALAFLAWPRGGFARRIRAAWLVPLAPLLLLPLLHLGVSHELEWSNSADIYLFSRLTALGISHRYLEEECKTRKSDLCATAETGFAIWDMGPRGFIREHGGFGSLVPEMREANRAMLENPRFLLDFAEGSVANAARQLVMVSGPLLPSLDDPVLRSYARSLGPFEASRYETQSLMRADRRAVERWGRALGWIHLGAILAALGALAARFRRLSALQARFFLLLGVAIVLNAVVCGTLTEPMDRYQTRIVFLLPLFVFYWVLSDLSVRSGTPVADDTLRAPLPGSF